MANNGKNINKPTPVIDPELRHRRIVSLTVTAIVVIFSLVIAYFVGRPLIKTARDPQLFREWIESCGWWGKFAMIGIMMLQVVVAVIPGEPFELGAGYAFGAWEGALLCLIGAALASALIMFVVGKFGVKVVELFFSKDKIKSLSFMMNSKKLNLLTFILFLIPGTPKDLMVYLIGITPMKIRTFMWISTIARIPSVVSSTLTGSMLGAQKYWLAVVTYGITIIVSLLCIWWYRKMPKDDPAESEEAPVK